MQLLFAILFAIIVVAMKLLFIRQFEANWSTYPIGDVAGDTPPPGRPPD